MVRWGDMGRLSFWFFPKKSCSFVRPTHCDEAWSLFGVDFSARRRMGVVASILLHLKSNRARRREFSVEMDRRGSIDPNRCTLVKLSWNSSQRSFK